MGVDVDHRADPDADEPRSGGIQVLARAANVLRALESSADGLSLGAIAKSVGLARSTVQRIVGALASEGFVVAASAEGRVRIGPGLLRIAMSLGDNSAALVRPHLHALAARVEETVDLAVLAGGSVVFIEQIMGKHRLAALSAIGARFPLHCSANGKAILACFSEDDADDLIAKSRQEHAEFPLRSVAKLRKELDEARRTHLAFDIEEHATGICAVGIAIPGPFGSPIAVSIPVPTQRFAKRREKLAKDLLQFRERMKPILAG
jgi:DNA-binding IclR family transcriptional regulator